MYIYIYIWDTLRFSTYSFFLHLCLWVRLCVELEIVDRDLLGYPLPRPQKFEWLVWPCPLIGHIPPLKIPLISLRHWVARRPYKVLSVISTNITWYTHLGSTFPAGFDRGLAIDLESYGPSLTPPSFWKLNFMKITIFLFPTQTSTNVTRKRFYDKRNLCTHTNSLSKEYSIQLF